MTEDIDFLVNNEIKLIRFDPEHEWPILYHAITDNNMMIKGLEDINVPVVNQNDENNNKVYMKLQDFNEENSQKLYLKDWHASLQYRNLRHEELYHIPEFLLDDWLDWYCRKCRNNDDDFRFIYIGQPNTSTGLHHDVCLSYSWSINLTGKKIWKFYPPHEVNRICKHHKKEFCNELISKISDENVIEIEQNIGEIIFVPSGYYHQVNNSENMITMSVNQNWFNAFNLYDIWRFILNELNLCRREIKHLQPQPQPQSSSVFSDSNSDIRYKSWNEWYQQCEIILGANSKFNILSFIELLASRCLCILKINNDYDNNNYNNDKRWIQVFCKNYLKSISTTTPLTELDERIDRYMSQRIISIERIFKEENVSINHLIVEDFSVVDYEIDIIIQRTISSDYLDDVDISKLKVINNDNDHHNINIETYSLIQIMRILRDIISSSKLIEHIQNNINNNINDSNNSSNNNSNNDSNEESDQNIKKLLLSIIKSISNKIYN